MRGDLAANREPGGPLLFAANAELAADGRLVAGAALAVRRAYPGVDRGLGRPLGRSGRRYGVAVAAGPARVGAFQTKLRWRDPADLGLVARAAARLGVRLERRPGLAVDPNHPGVGHGRLAEGDVAPPLEGLPGRVRVRRRRGRGWRGRGPARGTGASPRGGRKQPS